MYESIKDLLLDLFQAPKEPPDPPKGTHASITTFRASPQYLNYQYLMLFLVLFVLAVAFTIAGGITLQNNTRLGAILCTALALLWGVIGIGSYFLIRIEYEMRYYIVSDRSLRIRKGVWNILEQTLTFANIQNIKLEQGPIERMLGISRLVVETAGGGGVSAQNQENASSHNYHRAVMSGLDNAIEIRDLILNYLRKLPYTSGLGESPGDGFFATGTTSRPKGFAPRDIQVLQEILQEVRELRTIM